MSNENKKIENYLHLYLGCDAKITDVDRGSTVTPITCAILMKIEKYRIEPILRPLSDMTEEERIEYLETGQKIATSSHQHNALRIHGLLKKGFDLFGLIESGLAIDKTTLNVTPS